MRRVLLAAAAASIATAAVAAPPPITGRWLTVDGKGIVEIEPCGPALCGRLVRVLKPQPGQPTADINNPEPALRSRPLLGVAVLNGFQAAGDRWKGRIYDPVSGRSYRSELTRDGAELHVKGCLGPFCRTQEWTRAG